MVEPAVHRPDAEYIGHLRPGETAFGRPPHRRRRVVAPLHPALCAPLLRPAPQRLGSPR